MASPKSSANSCAMTLSAPIPEGARKTDTTHRLPTLQVRATRLARKNGAQTRRATLYGAGTDKMAVHWPVSIASLGHGAASLHAIQGETPHASQGSTTHEYGARSRPPA